MVGTLTAAVLILRNLPDSFSDAGVGISKHIDFKNEKESKQNFVHIYSQQQHAS